jgi:hypothetical protein
MLRRAVPAALFAGLLFTVPAQAGRRGAEFRSLALVPADSEFVFCVDVFSARKSDLVADLESRFDSVPEAAETYRRFVGETGLDPRQDIDQLVLAGRGVEKGSDPALLIVATGRFGPTRLVEALAEKGEGRVEEVAGTRVWTWSADPSGDAGDPPPGEWRKTALVQADEETILFGEASVVLRALEVVKKIRPPQPKEAKLREMLASVDRRAPVWAVFHSSALARKVSDELGRSTPEWNPGAALSAVENVRLMAWLGREVDLKVQVGARDAESAGLLADLVRGTLAAGKLAAKDKDPELLRILRETTVLETGTEIEIRARIPAPRFQEKPGAPGES